MLVWPRDVAGMTRTPTDDRDALFTAWVEGLDALADGQTQMWLVEDVHWAGGDVLAFLDLATARAAPGSRLIVATARPSLLETNPDWATDDGTNRRVLAPRDP